MSMVSCRLRSFPCSILYPLSCFSAVLTILNILYIQYVLLINLFLWYSHRVSFLHNESSCQRIPELVFALHLAASHLHHPLSNCSKRARLTFPAYTTLRPKGKGVSPQRICCVMCRSLIQLVFWVLASTALLLLWRR